MANARGPKRAAYQAAYNARPENVKKREANNAARAKYEKAHGDQPSNVDIDHKRMQDQGGGNGMDNLRARSQKDNRGWRKDHPGAYGKK